ncbi:UDP-4-amino-4,6-dideoxy-N-acetyl-beta-L-altrosamine N-acetyltransferase [Mesobacillus subterraneus]|uniref:UDP-4-amino-4, 6-dideoxy-N-acetyl-beta-L-altrosamine N-acetyltransferase n=1 Tax=Mesobacillus subterraneus TaxID=285983 RepID=UPI00203AE600|nr:UDP-4-amino-4,6-dideoxy-N-acetyl-beta-L-altrosamine N-acetyltransferase [Mesobacillus subterraneus]MCM3683415.1 UDP-4-amino-4,6-dideoxy-N-acetyl-beta-L-altrosamine N-acetyltransferase [Mesobacillus subterraneus]
MGAILRQVRESDLEMIMNWRMSPEVTKYMYTDPKLTIEDQQNWFKKINLNNDNEKYWIIELENGIPVGLMSVNNIDYRNQQASWAYYIASLEARGKGLGRILECNMYDYIFDTLGLNKLWCEVFEFNEKVIQIHEKFGSKIEGRLVDHIYKNGEFFNVIRMGIRRNEWEQLKGNMEYKKILIENY